MGAQKNSQGRRKLWGQLLNLDPQMYHARSKHEATILPQYRGKRVIQEPPLVVLAWKILALVSTYEQGESPSQSMVSLASSSTQNPILQEANEDVKFTTSNVFPLKETNKPIDTEVDATLQQSKECGGVLHLVKKATWFLQCQFVPSINWIVGWISLGTTKSTKTCLNNWCTL